MQKTRHTLARGDVVQTSQGYRVVWAVDGCAAAVFPVRYHNTSRRRSDVFLCPDDVVAMGVVGKNLMISVTEANRAPLAAIAAWVGRLPAQVMARLSRAVSDEMNAQAVEATPRYAHHETAVRM